MVTTLNLLAVSRNPVTAIALRAYCRIFLSGLGYVIDVIAVQAGAEISAHLERLSGDERSNTIVLFDVQPEGYVELDVKYMVGERALPAQLVLAFPEVYFVFLEPPGYNTLDRLHRSVSTTNLIEMRASHVITVTQLVNLVSLAVRHRDGFRALFDATGLRSALKAALYTELRVHDTNAYSAVVDSRMCSASAAADDEVAFAYLNALAAFKAGYRCSLLSTKREFVRVLSGRASGQIPIDVLLSDRDLRYEDEPGEVTREALQDVDLSGLDWLIFITSYEALDPQDSKRASHVLRVPKPYPGLFFLLEPESGRYRNALSIKYRSLVAHFVKTGSHEDTARVGLDGNVVTVIRHSAPYASGAIAERLLARARRLLRMAGASTQELSLVAVLAMEAKELFGGFSRTSFYEALALQNEAEVRAEMSFFGTLAQINVGRRLDALELESKLARRSRSRSQLMEMFRTGARQAVAGGTFSERLRRFRSLAAKVMRSGVTVLAQGRSEHAFRENEYHEARLNCIIQVVNNLRIEFGDSQQIRAAEECLVRVAAYERELNRRQRRWGWLSGRIAGVPAWYLDVVTAAGTSIARLMAVNLLWIAVFGALYYSLFSAHPLSYGWFANVQLAVWHAACKFVQLSPELAEVDLLRLKGTPGWGIGYHAAILVEGCIAYLHLGLLAAMLYRRILRKAP